MNSSIDFNSIPNEVLLIVFQFLPHATLSSKVLYVDRRFCQLSCHDIIWESRFKKVFSCFLKDSNYKKKVENLKSLLQTTKYKWKSLFQEFSESLAFENILPRRERKMEEEEEEGEGIWDHPFKRTLINPYNSNKTIKILAGSDDLSFLDENFKTLSETTVRLPISIHEIFYLPSSENQCVCFGVHQILYCNDKFEVIKTCGKTKRTWNIIRTVKTIELRKERLYVTFVRESDGDRFNPKEKCNFIVWKINPKTLLTKKSIIKLPETCSKALYYGGEVFKRVDNSKFGILNSSKNCIEVWDAITSKRVITFRVSGRFVSFESNGNDKILVTQPYKVTVWNWKLESSVPPRRRRKKVTKYEIMNPSSSSTLISTIINFDVCEQYERFSREFVVFNLCSNKISTKSMFMGYVLRKRTNQKSVKKLGLYYLKQIAKIPIDLECLGKKNDDGYRDKDAIHNTEWMVSKEISYGMVAIYFNGNVFLWNRYRNQNMLKKVNIENNEIYGHSGDRNLQIVSLQGGRKFGMFVPIYRLTKCMAECDGLFVFDWNIMDIKIEEEEKERESKEET